MDQSDNTKTSNTAISNMAPTSDLGMAAPDVLATATPNPMVHNNTVRYRLESDARVKIVVYNALGEPVKVLADKKQSAGIYSVDWNPSALPKGAYFVNITRNGETKQSIRLVKQ